MEWPSAAAILHSPTALSSASTSTAALVLLLLLPLPPLSLSVRVWVYACLSHPIPCVPWRMEATYVHACTHCAARWDFSRQGSFGDGGKWFGGIAGLLGSGEGSGFVLGVVGILVGESSSPKKKCGEAGVGRVCFPSFPPFPLSSQSPPRSPFSVQCPAACLQGCLPSLFQCSQ